MKKWKISELSSSYVECVGKDTPVGNHISNNTRFLLNSRNRFFPHNQSKNTGSEPVFVNVYGAQKSSPRDRFS
jgi:hypothetical protein